MFCKDIPDRAGKRVKSSETAKLLGGRRFFGGERYHLVYDINGLFSYLAVVENNVCVNHKKKQYLNTAKRCRNNPKL